MSNDTLGVGLRKRIIDDFNGSLKQKQICEKYSLLKSTVSRLITKFKKTGSCDIEHNGGCSRCTSSKEDALIARSYKKDPFKSSNKVQKDLTISNRTIRWRAVEVGLFSSLVRSL